MLDTNLYHNTTSNITTQQASPLGNRGIRLTPPTQRNATRVPPHVAEVCPHLNPENPATPTLLKPPCGMPISSPTGDATPGPPVGASTVSHCALSPSPAVMKGPTSTHFERQANKVCSAASWRADSAASILLRAEHSQKEETRQRPLHPREVPPLHRWWASCPG